MGGPSAAQCERELKDGSRVNCKALMDGRNAAGGGREACGNAKASARFQNVNKEEIRAEGR